jgi:hypothetical protein
MSILFLKKRVMRRVGGHTIEFHQIQKLSHGLLPVKFQGISNAVMKQFDIPVYQRLPHVLV